MTRGRESFGRDGCASSAAAAKPPKRTTKDADTRLLESDLSAALGLKVAIDHKGKSGVIKIAYKDLDQLDGLCQLLNAAD